MLRLALAVYCENPPGSLPVVGIWLRPPPPSSKIVIPIRRSASVSAMPAPFASVGQASTSLPGRLSPGVRCSSPLAPVRGATPPRVCAAGRHFVGLPATIDLGLDQLRIVQQPY